ncbi:MAG TPA: hypothetical protein V6D27_00770 [Vampirovibrionales bacterium]
MAIIPLNQGVLTAPGTYVGENAAGIAPVELASFNRCYMMGGGLDGNFAEPRQITDITDAINQFGLLPASVNARSIELFFRNNPFGNLFYTRVPIGGLWKFTLGGDPVVGDEVTLTLDALSVTPIVVSYIVTTAAAADMEILLQELVEAINNSASVAAIAIAQRIDPTAQSFNLRLLDPTTVVEATYSSLVAESGAGVTVATSFVTATALHPTRDDFLWAMQEAFDPDEHRQGFLIAPEAFKYFETQADRVAMGQAMHSHCSSEGYDWMPLVDCGPPSQVPDPTAALAEGRLYSAPFGHLAYYFPYLIDLNEDEIPPSPAVAAIALRRYRSQGFPQPPAGTQFPIEGVIGVKCRVKREQQSILNPEGINVVRAIPNNGIVVYGARTRSNSPFYRFVNTRIILSVLIGTLRDAFHSEVFTANDGQGILFSRLRETAQAICYRLYAGGALYGATPEDAYYILVDSTNNPNLDLEAGVARMDIYVVPAPTTERILISVNRTAIGGIDFIIRQAT